jgi:hypothetical protein
MQFLEALFIVPFFEVVVVGGGDLLLFSFVYYIVLENGGTRGHKLLEPRRFYPLFSRKLQCLVFKSQPKKPSFIFYINDPFDGFFYYTAAHFNRSII